MVATQTPTRFETHAAAVGRHQRVTTFPAGGHCFASIIEDITERKRSEDQLRESREDLNRAQAVAHTGSWRLDVHRNERVWSEEHWRIFGVPRDTPLTYETFLGTVHPDDRAYVRAKWSAALRGEPYDIEHRAETGRFAVIFSDVTKLRDMQRREKEDAIRLAWGQSAIGTIDAMREGVALPETDGTITSVNPAVERLTGFAGGAVVGRNVVGLLSDLMEGTDLEAARQGFAVLRQGGTPRLPVLFLLKRSNGRSLHVLPTVSLMEEPEGGRRVAVLTIKDVTDLHEATQRLEQSERKYRELVENANRIILRITPDHTITFFNEYAQQFLGYEAGKVLGRNVLGTIAPEVDSEGRDLRSMVRDITASPELHAGNENENMCRDGRRVWVHWANRAVRDEQGNVVEILCVGTDVTQRREMAQEARRYQQRLRKLAERLVASEEEDRWRISRHVHDTITQNLSLSCIRLATLAKPLSAARQEETAGKLRQVEGLVGQPVGECRMVMSDLTPALLYELGCSRRCATLPINWRRHTEHASSSRTTGGRNPCLAHFEGCCSNPFGS